MPTDSWPESVTTGLGVVSAGLTAWTTWIARRRPAAAVPGEPAVGQSPLGGADAGADDGTYTPGTEHGTDRPDRRELGDERR